MTSHASIAALNTALIYSFFTVFLLLPFAASAASCPNLYRNISFGSRGQDVVELQTFLIAEGDLGAGNNTGYFGRLTVAAVQKWQARNGLVSSGTAATTGYGAVGPRTRAKIASVCGSGGSVSTNFSASPTFGVAPLAVAFRVFPIPGSQAEDYIIEFGDGEHALMHQDCEAAGEVCMNIWKTNHTYRLQGKSVAILSKLKPYACGLQNAEGVVDCAMAGSKVVGTVTIIVTSGASTNLSCTSDSQCPSSNYTCETVRGTATACAYNSNGTKIDLNCRETTIILEGVCKLKEGNRCSTHTDCSGGNLCHAGICTNPVGRVCSGAYDTSCGVGWQCTQDCGPPVPSQYDPPPAYHCRIDNDPNDARTWRACPICLAGSTLIDTPTGKVPVKDVQKGMSVWTTDAALKRISGIVTVASRVPVVNHTVVKLVLDDGRVVSVSPGHPTIDGRTIGDLKAGDTYDGATVVSAERVPYTEDATYDLLPSGDTGFYWADGILLGSTLSH